MGISIGVTSLIVDGWRVPEFPSVSVVVPTFNGAPLLERILRPLLDDPAASEVIVVVDGSRDGSFDLVERLVRPASPACEVC